MSMIEKLAERVREQDKEGCAGCLLWPKYSSACMKQGETCPNMGTPEGALMLARWAVKLVAEGLKGEAEALRVAMEYEMEQDTVLTGLMEMGALRALGNAFLALISEAEKEASDAK